MSETVDVLAVGAHPDDVELGCGGTLARLGSSGRRLGIVHLTRGEAGTRGSPEERLSEARRAGDVLGAHHLELLDCGDGGLRRGRGEEDGLISVLRRLRPSLVLAPAPADRHPDHGRAHRLVVDACFYAGLAKRSPELGEPHRPAALLCYMQHDAFAPSLIVDITLTWERKRTALQAYASQLYDPDSRRDDPPTKVSSREFLAAVEGRARHFGLLIGVEFGEPFWSPTPVGVGDLWPLVVMSQEARQV